MCNNSQLSNDLGLTDKNHACACSTEPHTATEVETHAQAGAEVIREHYLVEGMTCSHCVASVTEEVSALDGVQSVSVDLKVGGESRIMVVSDRPVAIDKIRDAVTTAGYSMAAE